MENKEWLLTDNPMHAHLSLRETGMTYSFSDDTCVVCPSYQLLPKVAPLAETNQHDIDIMKIRAAFRISFGG